MHGVVNMAYLSLIYPAPALASVPDTGVSKGLDAHLQDNDSSHQSSEGGLSG